MDYAARRSALTVAALTTASALALTTVTIASHETPVPLRVSAQTVHLADAWSELFADTGQSVIGLAALALGANPTYPLPSPTIPLAPVATQLVLNQLIYVAQLFTGNAGQIPGEITHHLNEVGQWAQLVIGAAPGVALQQLQVPFTAAKLAIESIGTSGNLLTGLLEAPAVFLNFALNNQFGLLGFTGPIGFSLILRNLLSNAIYTQPPAIVLPFKKASAGLTPKSTAAEAITPKPSTPSGTASSARSKPKKPSSASSSNRKPATSAKGASGGAQGHGKRG